MSTSVQNVSDVKAPDESLQENHPDVRVAVVGNVDSGKSTLIGVLTSGGLDNGRGLARSKVFLHRHEANNGRTSAVGQHILGFDQEGQIVHQTVAASASSMQKNKSWRDVVKKSSSILTLVDLAGHEKYLKTTIAGLTGCYPDYALVVVGANMGVTKMTKEHLGVVIALNIPVIIVITKIDMCPPNVLARTKKHLYRILKSPAAKSKSPFHIRNDKDVDMALKNVGTKLTPVFMLSTVTGENLAFLTNYLAGIKPRQTWVIDEPLPPRDSKEVADPDVVDSKMKPKQPCEYNIDETFTVPGVGLVVSGTVSRGTLFSNKSMLLGPFHDGSFIPVLTKTIHAKRTPVESCNAGSSCAVAIRAQSRKHAIKRSDIRRAMILKDADDNATQATWKFEAEVLVLHHPTTIKKEYQAVIHCGMVRQTASLRRISSDCLRTGDRANVEFEFLIHPEVVHPGQILLFREGNTKGMGRITRLLKGRTQKNRRGFIPRNLPSP